jgi:hypothetical protein
MSNYVVERENNDGTVQLSISSHRFTDERQSSCCFDTDEQAAQYLLDQLQTNPQARASTFERLSAQATVEHWSYCNVITHLANNAVFLDNVGYLAPRMTEMTIQRFESELQAAQYCQQQINNGAMVYKGDEEHIGRILSEQE